MTDFSPAVVESRIQAAIRPVLEKADLMEAELLDGRPLKPVGKHHWDTRTVKSHAVILGYELSKLKPFMLVTAASLTGLGLDAVRLAEETQQIPKRHLLGAEWSP